MKKTALRSCTLALGLVVIGSFSARVSAQTTATTDPVGFYTLNIVGGSDSVMALPMIRDAVFAGTVGGGITTNSFNALAGTVSPGWTASQFKYVVTAQPQTYFVEFTSGALKGVFYKIEDNGTGSVTVDPEGDSLTTARAYPGNPAGALAVGDSFKIRAYWRIRDVFEVNGAPIIDPRPNLLAVTDEILIPNYSTVDTNKAPTLTIFYLAGQGWRGAGQGATDFGDFILRPTESFIVRRRNAATVSLPNLGGVLMNRSISFLPGGNGTSANDVFFSINRPAAVSLNASGLRTADQATSVIVDSPNSLARQDELLAFDDAPGFNRAPIATYYYLAGQGWRQVSNPSTTVGDDVLLQPGKSYIIRKKSANAGRDWVNDANY